jgi:hypothetical protein
VSVPLSEPPPPTPVLPDMLPFGEDVPELQHCALARRRTLLAAGLRPAARSVDEIEEHGRPGAHRQVQQQTRQETSIR